MNELAQKFANDSDEVLLERILSGEKHLYECIIRRYNQRLFRTGMALLNNESEVEEAIQSTYVKAWEHLVQFANRASFGTWLTRIMLNECLAQKKKADRFVSGVISDERNYRSMHTPANTLMNKELGSVLQSTVAGLPEKFRLVFVLREVEELSVRETAAVLGIGEPNVKVRLNRAKSMLKESLNGYMKDHVYSFHLSRCDMIVASVFSKLKIYSPG
jgi:RNA polymerase sigma factor (sigma-70 family)